MEWVISEDGVSDSSLTQFHNSSWFERGWTLQELLAPSTVIFFDQHWDQLGSKVDLSKRLSIITGIPSEYLCNLQNLNRASVAMKMSWASRRHTSRDEDAAYCLLGVFDVNMPLLYGEGRRAFLRLQLEIIRKSDDESIFAWTTIDTSSQ